MAYESTPKGDAFIRYYFIDRGSEKDLDMDEAMEDFENYIYKPIARYVMEQYVTEASILAIEAVVGEGEEIRPLTEEEALQAAQEIGLAVLHTFKDLNSRH